MYITLFMLKSVLLVGNKIREFRYKYNYGKWSIKRRGSYFIFPVISMVPIQELRFFQLQAKH